MPVLVQLLPVPQTALHGARGPRHTNAACLPADKQTILCPHCCQAPSMLPNSPGYIQRPKQTYSCTSSSTEILLYQQEGKKMAFPPRPPSGAQCLGLHSRIAVSQQYFGRISLSQVLVWCVGGQELTSEKKVPFLKLNLISYRCVSTKPINFLSMPKQPEHPSEGLPVVPKIQPAADWDPELAKSSQQL